MDRTTALLACRRCGGEVEVDLRLEHTLTHTIVEARPLVPFLVAHLDPVLLDPLP